MAEDGIVVPSVGDLVAPSHAALLVVDVQLSYEQNPNFMWNVPETVAHIRRLVDAARSAGVKLVFIRAIESDETNTAVWISRHLTKPYRIGKYRVGTPGAEFHPDLKPGPDDVVISKLRYSAFLGTGLDELLRSANIETVIVTGIAANVCVEVTACEAFQRDYWTLVVSDCVTTRNAEEQQQALHDAAGNWGIVVESNEIIAAWQKPSTNRVPVRAAPASRSM